MLCRIAAIALGPAIGLPIEEEMGRTRVYQARYQDSRPARRPCRSGSAWPDLQRQLGGEYSRCHLYGLPQQNGKAGQWGWLDA